MDIGCVAHDVARMSSEQWLHGRLATVASSCIGVDVHHDGVQEMNRRGFRAVVHDLSAGVGPLAEQDPFDVIVAGELIEHVESVSMLFTTANALLAPDGELVLTTPNPWAPHRVRAGQLGYAWENTDHIFLAFPSGIAELAERHGLVLAEAATTRPESGIAGGGLVRRVKRWIRGSRWLTVGFGGNGGLEPVRIVYGRVGSVIHGTWWPRRRFVGETFVYVVRRGDESVEERSA